jgi:hypothetical protein
MRKPEFPDAFADPLFGLYHSFEGAPGPDEMLGKRRSEQKCFRLSSNLVVKAVSMARPAEGQLNLGFHPVNECWRPLLLVAAAFEEAQTFYRPKRRIQPTVAANRCNKRSNRLQGTQLALFLDPPDDPNFYRPVRIFAHDPDRPLADVFPEAYLDSTPQ